MKKILLCLIIIAMVATMVASFSMIGCKTEAEDEETEEAVEEEVAEEAVEEEVAEEAVEEEVAEEAKQITVGWVCWDYTSEIWGEIKTGCETLSADRGWEFIPTTNDNDNSKMVAAFENFITMGVDGILVSMYDPQAVAEVTLKAKDAGIPVVALFGPYPEVTAFSDLNNITQGELSGVAIAKWMNENYSDATEAKPVEWFIMNLPEIAAVEQRITIIKDAVEENAEVPYEIVATQAATLIEEAQNVTEAVLQSNPNLNIIYGVHPDSAIGAVNALKAHSISKEQTQVFLTGVTKQILQMMTDKDYIVHTTEYGGGLEMAKPAIEVMEKILNNEDYQEENYIEQNDVYQDDAADVYERFYGSE